MPNDRPSSVADRPRRPARRSFSPGAAPPASPAQPEPVAAYCIIALLFGPGMLLWSAGLAVTVCRPLAVAFGLAFCTGGAGLLALGALALWSVVRGYRM